MGVVYVCVCVYGALSLERLAIPLRLFLSPDLYMKYFIQGSQRRMAFNTMVQWEREGESDKHFFLKKAHDRIRSSENIMLMKSELTTSVKYSQYCVYAVECKVRKKEKKNKRKTSTCTNIHYAGLGNGLIWAILS